MSFENLFNGIYKDKRVFITGHTGFKGSWLAKWLNELGAEVIGYSLEPQTSPNHFNLLNLKKDIISIIGDIRDTDKLNNAIKVHKPEIIFHLAAQAIVRDSYANPVDTYQTNIMGTVNLFEALRKHKFIKAFVNITSDKCYENNEWVYGYRESDAMGGYDPYSCSKGCSELITASYRNSFFNIKDYNIKHSVLIASVRAGNVIGGGDWAKDRIIPDIIRAAASDKEVIIRNPKSTRPWQHVLEPLSGYLLIGAKLLQNKKEFSGAWNFGPNDPFSFRVEDVLKSMKSKWEKINYRIEQNKDQPHEAGMLRLDCSKANNILKWIPIWNQELCIQKTANWYKNFYVNNKINTGQDLKEYIIEAEKKNLIWTQ